ncbi:hypothetical protein TRFO_12660 [Tritrichomonas foetus]|uniref:Uncharacterized protein n=1 Tax=Tritrichomonas foetus TaxID=1144522 RepID=A0A1J4L564_9EUKA|nr:hypothetical protein TRFO_12660 [Tritrichomonas foetus]|eukprot:OHT17132.1 hypothetical protein TRFO_12660 [Tritrichomonas foetus]
MNCKHSDSSASLDYIASISSSTSRKELEEKLMCENNKRANELLTMINRLNSSQLEDDSLFDEIDSMIDDTELTNSQWKMITKMMVNQIRSQNGSCNSSPRVQSSIEQIEEFELRGHQIPQNKKHNLWEKPRPLVPFDVGMKILNGKLNESEIGEKTKKGILIIENDANKMAHKRMNENSEYKKLFREKEHWKYLAQTRLVELEKEINFRYELVFGETSKKTLL